MNEELETATPAAVQTEQAQSVETPEVTPEATTEQTQETTPAEQAEAPKKEPWFQKRIGELTREKYEAKRQAETAAQEAQQYREQLARIQQGEQTEQPVGDVRTLVQQEAARLLAEQTFNERCNKVYEQGAKDFPNFDAAVKNLQLVGVSREFFELATTADASAKLLHHLGTDLDEASRIAALPPIQMARELTKLELKLNQPAAPKPVSKAPAPISPLTGTKGGSKDPSEMTDDEFAQWRRSFKKS